MRSIGDSWKATLAGIADFFKDALGMNVGDRVESARITRTRMKALEKPDYLEDKPKAPPGPKTPFEEAQQEIVYQKDTVDAMNKLGVALPDPEEPAPGRSRGTAEMSHFRLAAYVASLSDDEKEAQAKALKEATAEEKDGRSSKDG